MPRCCADSCCCTRSIHRSTHCGSCLSSYLFKIRWFWIVAYLIADAALGIGIFRYFYQLDMNLDPSKYEAVVQASVWGHVILLAVFFFLFLRVPLRYPLAGGTDQIANSDNNLPTHSREHA